MKDFAKSIVCNTKAEVGNNTADDKYQEFILKYGHPNTKEEAERLIELAKKEGIHPDYIKGLKRGFASRWGNRKVGNSDILSGNYIILADNGEVWFRDEHENVHIRNIDSWAQKRIASYQSSIDEIKKGVAEAKQAAKKAGMI